MGEMGWPLSLAQVMPPYMADGNQDLSYGSDGVTLHVRNDVLENCPFKSTDHEPIQPSQQGGFDASGSYCFIVLTVSGPALDSYWVLAVGQHCAEHVTRVPSLILTAYNHSCR